MSVAVRRNVIDFEFFWEMLKEQGSAMDYLLWLAEIVHSVCPSFQDDVIRRLLW